MAAKLVATVTWRRQAQLNHPAFDYAVQIADGVWQKSFPIGKGYLEGRKAQQAWAEDNVRHLRTFGLSAEIGWRER
jgi:hypothetical protein